MVGTGDRIYNVTFFEISHPNEFRSSAKKLCQKDTFLIVQRLYGRVYNEMSHL